MSKCVSPVSSDSQSAFILQPNTGEQTPHVRAGNYFSVGLTAKERDETGLPLCSAIDVNTFTFTF